MTPWMTGRVAPGTRWRQCSRQLISVFRQPKRSRVNRVRHGPRHWPLEHGLRRTLLAVCLGQEVGLDPDDLSTSYYVALLGTLVAFSMVRVRRGCRRRDSGARVDGSAGPVEAARGVRNGDPSSVGPA